MNIAIVGANSFLSQSLLNKLCNEHSIIQVYHKNTNRINTKFQSIQITDFLKQRPIVDCIYFVASHINFDETIASIHNVFETNISLLKELSEAFSNAKIIHTSSVSVYENSDQIINEDSPLNPKSSYGLAKLWAEFIVKEHSGVGINIRISSLFGEGMNENTFLPMIIRNAITQHKITIYGDGSRKQNYIHVNDASQILFKALNLEESINLLAVSDKSYSNLEVAEIVKGMVTDVEIVHFEKDNSLSFFYDNSKTKALLEAPFVDNFKQNVHNTILWIQKQY